MEITAETAKELIHSAADAVAEHNIWSGKLPPHLLPSITPCEVFGAIKTYWHSLTPHSLRLSRDGKIHPATQITIHRLDTRLADGMEYADVERLFKEGYTIVYRQLANRHPSISLLASSICNAFSAWPSINLYLTPPGGQGFAEHADDHDVLIFHCFGSKIWSFRSGSTVPNESTLSPGAILFLPEGIRHSARASSSSSIHLTIGFRPPSMDQYFAWLGERIHKLGTKSQYLGKGISVSESVLLACQSNWSSYLNECRRGFGRATLGKQNKGAETDENGNHRNASTESNDK